MIMDAIQQLSITLQDHGSGFMDKLTRLSLKPESLEENAGNIITPHGAGIGGEAATIEFAI
jgi:hypothetical protein